MYMYTNNQENNAVSTFVRKWSLNMKVLMKFLITETRTPDFTAQNQRIENIQSIKNKTCNYKLDNPLEMNMIFLSDDHMII